MDNHQLINQTTGNQEWGTPSVIVEAARKVMGRIDLDPATCVDANKTVMATCIFTKDDNGLDHTWFGNVWLNHPFGDSENPCKPICTKQTCVKRGKLKGLNTPIHADEYTPGNADWIKKLIREWNEGNITQALCITYAATSETWFRPLKSFPICYIDGRTNYIDLNTGNQIKGVSKGSCVTYLGHNLSGFEEHFTPLGDVMWPTRYVDRGFFRGCYGK